VKNKKTNHKKETLMKTKLFLLFVLFISLVLVTSCGKSEKHDSMNDDGKQVESQMIRDYDVDVVTIDENGDGNVFQCPMDWEVLSDQAGSCPLCNMDLKEYSVAEAQKNLGENRPYNH
jgi:major membrane immunogen (membrane-anchored lipoprotein)